MEHKTITSILTGTLTLQEIVGYYLIGLIGLVFSLVLEVYRKRKDIMNKGGFSLAYFIKDNVFRIVLSLLVILIGVLFGESVIGISLTQASAFGLGFATDKVIEAFFKTKE